VHRQSRLVAERNRYRQELLVRAHPEAAIGKLRTLEAVERDQITRNVESTDWQISGAKGAAAILGMNPNTLRSRILKLGISRAG
jgi:formate hydrogenlyase transcriptional activator